ncbi:MAG: hypothetical protein HQM16_17150 [Deltaproteobacteria bacterium]|nr:hypothetical protein [Deltaproteobacteria bacterium]
MVGIKRNLFVFFVVLVLGIILGTLGTLSFPINNNITNFWPAAALQTVSGIFFGWWGIAAGTLFPTISNALTDGTLQHVFGLLPSNLVQSALPYLIFRKFNLSMDLKKRRDIVIFCFLCATLPHVLGGVLGCVLLYIFHAISSLTICIDTMQTWWIGNIPCSIIFSFLLLKFAAPALHFSGLLDVCEDK